MKGDGKKQAAKSRFSSGKPWMSWIPWLAGALALGLWHMTDVRAGVLGAGHVWLYGWYGALLAAGVLILAALGYGMSRGLLQRPERLFVCAVLGLGLCCLFVLPPLSAPDEVSHYISAYQLSNRLLGKEAHDENGRVYIRARDAWIEDMQDVMKDDGSGRRGADNDADVTARILGQELTEDTYSTIHSTGLGGLRGYEGETALSYQPAVRTTPLAYLPQALGFTLARLLGVGSMGLLYLGRLFNLLFFTALGYFTVKKLPFGKEVFLGAALLPMSLHLASSLSYDVWIMALGGYFTAVCLHLAYKAERVALKDVAALALVMALMGPCKMVYGAIAGFCLLIPVKKFGGWGRWAASAAAVLGAFGAAMVFVNLGTVSMYTEAQSGYIAWAGEPGYTLAQLLHSPVHVIKLCYNTLMWQGEALYSGLIGGALGNKDAVLNTPYAVILALTVILLVLALKKPGETMLMSLKNRLWIWFICLAVLGALMFSMLLAWTPVSANMVQGVQGRYLLPLLPIFLMTLKNDRVVRTGFDDRGLLYGMLAMDMYVIWRLFSVVCLRL